MAVTLKELAAKCGLSVATVSKALNDYSDIGEETRKRVRLAAQEMGYKPSSIARGLKTGRTYNLGVIYSDDTASGFTHCYFGPVLQAFRQEAEQNGYDLTFINGSHSGSHMDYLEHCLSRHVDGVCVVCAPAGDAELGRLLSSSIPAVTVDFLYNNRTCVQSENRKGMELLTRYVLAMGHRRIALIRGAGAHNPVADVRQAIFLGQMKQAGIEVPDVYLAQGEFHDPRSARRATRELLRLSQPPTCILMSDDYAAQGGLQEIRQAGLRVPEDISVAGYDGVSWIQSIRPHLTTIWQDTQTIGREAARQLMAQIEQPRTALAEIITVPCRLIEGETVRDLNTANH